MSRCVRMGPTLVKLALRSGVTAVLVVVAAGCTGGTDDGSNPDADVAETVDEGADVAETVEEATDVPDAADDGPTADPTAFRLTGSLAVARDTHTATRLLDGRVLVVGGESTSGAMLASIEIFDPSSETWSSGGSLPVPICNHTATLLADGRVLVAGGGPSNSVGGPAPSGIEASAWLYDPAAGAVSAAASMADARSAHTATLLPDGRVLVVGGATNAASGVHGRALDGAEIYDPAADAWTAVAPLAVRRFLHTAVPSREAASSSRGLTRPSASSWIPRSWTWRRTWSAGPPIAESRVFHVAAPLPSGGALIAAGKLANIRFLETVERLDASLAEWRSAPPLPESRTAPALAVLSNGRVFLCGGLHGSTSGFYHLDDAQIYDEPTDAWTALEPMNVARVLHTATPLDDGRVLIVGGLGSSGALASVELAE